MVQYNIVTTIILVFKREGYQALSQLTKWVFLRMGGLILPRSFHMSQNLYGCGRIARTVDHTRERKEHARQWSKREVPDLGEKVFGICRRIPEQGS